MKLTWVMAGPFLQRTGGGCVEQPHWRGSWMIPNKLSGFGSPKQRIPDAYWLVCLVQEVNSRDHSQSKNLSVSTCQGVVSWFCLWHTCGGSSELTWWSGWWTDDASERKSPGCRIWWNMFEVQVRLEVLRQTMEQHPNRPCPSLTMYWM